MTVLRTRREGCGSGVVPGRVRCGWRTARTFSDATASCPLLFGRHDAFTLSLPTIAGVSCITRLTFILLSPRTVIATSFCALAVVRNSAPSSCRSPSAMLGIFSSASAGAFAGVFAGEGADELASGAIADVPARARSSKQLGSANS
jgi:hypothetical protein